MFRHRLVAGLAALAAGCGAYSSDPSASPPARGVGVAPAPAPQEGGVPRRMTAVAGTRYDLAMILVPGSVTVVKFTAPW